MFSKYESSIPATTFTFILWSWITVYPNAPFKRWYKTEQNDISLAQISGSIKQLRTFNRFWFAASHEIGDRSEEVISSSYMARFDKIDTILLILRVLSNNIWQGMLVADYKKLWPKTGNFHKKILICGKCGPLVVNQDIKTFGKVLDFLKPMHIEGQLLDAPPYRDSNSKFFTPP